MSLPSEILDSRRSLSTARILNILHGDELNWEFVATGVEDSGNGAYPLSNACGQGPVHSGRLFPATAPDAFVRMRSSPPFILQSRRYCNSGQVF
mmetsp:Transcript_14498/g.32765  ORF Transcript_14498/g.32765 Transcript_14498/m.32765 type:complete len:94 (-) Transcript_14498:114-395(-)